jgi:2,4-dienoyl-CoA reductase-like NADH-dependent reductase (Old Yellow Enzyme family)/thioredoxin reductase
MKYQKLFEPGKIGKLNVKNRIVMAPMHIGLVSAMGEVTQRMIDYYVERAKGGVGMIIVENACVDWPVAKVSPAVLTIHNDKFIAGLADLVEEITPYDVKTSIQLHHAGRQTTLRNLEGQQLVAPSAIPSEGAGGDIPRALSIEEILDTENKFVEAAYRAKLAGFDSVELHAAHGYLFTQFLSPVANRRTDLYGGSLENRARFSLEVVEKIKDRLGEDFPIIYRFSAEERVKGGLTLDESKIVVQMLEKAGVDAFHVSAGCYDARPWIVPCYDMPHGVLVPYAEEIKKVVNVPVITVGRLGIEPELCERILEEGKADFIALARPLLTDAEWTNKVRDGRLEDIRPCIYCNDGCQGRQFRELRVSCDLNYEQGRERDAKIKPTEKVKKVIVIGGGPGGMEVAMTAKLRGHDVTLYEKSGVLGGQLIAASAPPFKSDYKALLNYYIGQMKKLGIDVKLNEEATISTVKKLNPDVVIVATGAIPLIPDILGINSKNVVLANDVILGLKKVGTNVIVIGGSYVGCETAWLLAQQGKKVTLLTRMEKIAPEMNIPNRALLQWRFDELGITVLTRTHPIEITEHGVTAVTESGKKLDLEADNVVVARGSVSVKDLGEELQGKVKEVYMIGDCVEPRTLREAIHEGARIGRMI